MSQRYVNKIELKRKIPVASTARSKLIKLFKFFKQILDTVAGFQQNLFNFIGTVYKISESALMPT